MLLLTALTSPTNPTFGFMLFMQDGNQLAMKSSAGTTRVPVICVGTNLTQVPKTSN